VVQSSQVSPSASPQISAIVIVRVRSRRGAVVVVVGVTGVAEAVGVEVGAVVGGVGCRAQSSQVSPSSASPQAVALNGSGSLTSGRPSSSSSSSLVAQPAGTSVSDGAAPVAWPQLVMGAPAIAPGVVVCTRITASSSPLPGAPSSDASAAMRNRTCRPPGPGSSAHWPATSTAQLDPGGRAPSIPTNVASVGSASTTSMFVSGRADALR
jgi:hypothetical protein